VVAKSKLELAEKELARTNQLISNGTISKQLNDIGKTERDVAVASLAGAEANLVSAQRNVDAAKAGGEEVSAMIDDAELTSTFLDVYFIVQLSPAK